MLTPKQNKFIEVYIETGNASEAYRQAYNVKSMNENTINRNAHSLLYNNKIVARLDEIKAKNAERTQVTLEYLTNRLIKAADMAEEQGKAGELGQNVQRVATLTGFWKENQQLTVESNSPESWAQEYLAKRTARKEDKELH